MGNPELTRAKVLEAACLLFNKKGYKATSISDITKKAQVTKGSIYSHFQDKSELEKEALRYMCSQMLNDLSRRIKQAENSREKLYCILDYFGEYGKKPPFQGGCPLMNAAIETDDSNPELKKVVKYIMGHIHDSVSKIISNGKKFGQIKKEIHPQEMASFIIATLEGSVMMLKIFDNNDYLNHSIKNVRKEIDSFLIQ